MFSPLKLSFFGDFVHLLREKKNRYIYNEVSGGGGLQIYISNEFPGNGDAAVAGVECFENHKLRQFLLRIFRAKKKKKKSRLFCGSKLQEVIPSMTLFLLPKFGTRLCQILKLIVLTQGG